jgi:chaperonin GroEL
MKKISITGYTAREKALAGIDYVAKAITSTIGNSGLNFLLEKGRKSSNDGYLIASELVNTIPDEYERLSAQMAHEASSKTNDMVGDATSTAWALTGALCKETARFLPNDKLIKAKKNPAEIRKMIAESKEYALAELESMVTPITSKEELIKSALVSVEDEEIAKLLGETQWELGKEGRIIAEEVNDQFSSIERVTGIRLDNGFGASHLVTDQEKNTLEVRNMPIILTNYTVGIEELTLFKEAVFKHLISKKQIGCIVIARAFTSEAIKLCQESAAAGFAIFPINAPYTDQREMMKDIEAVVGGRYIDNEESSLADIYITDVGFAKKLVARIFDAVVTGTEDENSKKRISKRAEELKKKLIGSQSDFEKKYIDQRIAQLLGGFALLKVGHRSVTERKRLKDKCDDATQAVRHALSGGTVPGGGLAFKAISDKMEDTDILKRPLLVVHDQIVTSNPDDFVIESWVRDPYIILKTALENACSFATVFAATNGIITTANPKEKPEE